MAKKVGYRVALTTGGGGLAGIDVADNDDVDVKLLLTARSVSASASISCR